MKKTQWYIGAPNGVVLCINRNDEGELSGEFYHSYSETPVPFQGIGQMTLRMEKLYDWLRLTGCAFPIREPTIEASV